MNRIDPQIARTWRAWHSGPRELQLECEGSALARAAYELYRRWPLPRGRTRFEHGMEAASRSLGSLRDVPFRTNSGVRAYLDLGTPQFCELAGVAPTEPFELSVLLRLLRQGDTFVDVGAHFGLYSMHASGVLGRGGRCIAVEPDPGNAAAIRACLGEEKNVEILGVAASDRAGTGRLAGAGALDARLVETGDGLDVPIARLDEAIDLSSGECIVKIDVERHEPQVLRGITKWIERGVKPLLQIEYLPDEPESSSRHRLEMSKVFREILGDYQFFLMCPRHGSCHPFAPGEDPVESDVLNLLACPPHLKERVEQAVVIGC